MYVDCLLRLVLVAGNGNGKVSTSFVIVGRWCLHSFISRG